MKICVIGNSHIASLKQGWDHLKHEFPTVDLVFFAAAGARINGLQVQDGRLVPGDEALSAQLAMVSGGLTEIVPGDYDTILLYGLGLKVPRLPAGTSGPLRRRACREYLVRKTMRLTLRKLRDVTDMIIWVGPSPLHGPENVPSPHVMMDYPDLLDSLQEAIRDDNIAMLGQPADTITPDLTSHEIHVQGSFVLPKADRPQSLGRLHSVTDRMHMNGEFGALWLRHNLPQVMMLME